MLAEFQYGDLWAAEGADVMWRSDAARDEELTALPVVAAGEESFIVDGRPGARESEDADLAAVGVTAQHQIPAVFLQMLFPVRIMAEQDCG